MKKHVFMLAAFSALMVFAAGHVLAMANPAAQYAEAMGYEHEIREGGDGSQYGVVVFPDDSQCEAWEFYRGLCGVEWSYCERNGYTTQPCESCWSEGASCLDEDGQVVGTLYELVLSDGGAGSGGLLWSYPTGGTVESSPALGEDGTVYAGSFDGRLYAVGPGGQLKWRFETGGGIESSPAVGEDGTVYVGSKDSVFYALEPDGDLKWSFDDPEYDLPFLSSPVLGGDGTVYAAAKQDAGTNFGQFYAIDPQGNLKWRHSLSDNCKSAAVGPDGIVYLGDTADGTLYALYPDGTVKWSTDLGGGIDSSPALGSGSTLYVGGGKKLYALNLGGTVKWSYGTGGIVASSPAVGPEGTVYVGSYDGRLHAVSPEGKLRWSYDTGDRVYSSPAVGADGTVYVGSDSGKLYALGPDGSLRWSFSTNGWIGSSPTVGLDGTVYAGSWDNLLYALKGGSGGLADAPWPMFGHDARHTGRREEGGAGPVVIDSEQAEIERSFSPGQPVDLTLKAEKGATVWVFLQAPRIYPDTVFVRPEDVFCEAHGQYVFVFEEGSRDLHYAASCPVSRLDFGVNDFTGAGELIIEVRKGKAPGRLETVQTVRLTEEG